MKIGQQSALQSVSFVEKTHSYLVIICKLDVNSIKSLSPNIQRVSWEEFCAALVLVCVILSVPCLRVCYRDKDVPDEAQAPSEPPGYKSEISFEPESPVARCVAWRDQIERLRCSMVDMNTHLLAGMEVILSGPSGSSLLDDFIEIYTVWNDQLCNSSNIKWRLKISSTYQRFLNFKLFIIITDSMSLYSSYLVCLYWILSKKFPWCFADHLSPWWGAQRHHSCSLRLRTCSTRRSHALQSSRLRSSLRTTWWRGIPHTLSATWSPLVILTWRLSGTRMEYCWGQVCTYNSFTLYYCSKVISVMLWIHVYVLILLLQGYKLSKNWITPLTPAS